MIRRKLEGWLFNVFAGKLLARAAVTLAAYLVSAPVQMLLKSVGVTIEINQAELTAGLIALAHSLFEYVKKRRMANPESLAVQTDPSLLSASAIVAALPAIISVSTC